MKYKIGIDIGGFDSEIALIKDNKILKLIVFKTPLLKEKFVKKLHQEISNLIKDIPKNKIDFVGICVPGAVDSKKGILIKSPNIKNLKNFNFLKFIKNNFKLKSFLENDANCAAIAELKKRKCHNLVFLTLGTGIGSGVIIKKELYKGNSMASEIGHTTIKFDGLKCSCGNKGCFEQYVSIRALKSYIHKEFKKDINFYDFKKLIKERNKKALKICNKLGKYLGVGLANISNIFDPDIIVLGGGLSNFGEYFLNPAIKEMKKRVFFRPSKVEISKIKNIGVRGACFLNK
jgi:glucokinase